MRCLAIVVALAACGDKRAEPVTDQPAPHHEDRHDPAVAEPVKDQPAPHHEDRHDPAVAAPALSLAITLDGRATTWGQDVFDRTPHFESKNHDGQDRDTWSLRALAHGARVTAVIGESKVAIGAAAWGDPARTPIVHRTRRGGLKFRWADAAGAWAEVGVKDVTGLEVSTK